MKDPVSVLPATRVAATLTFMARATDLQFPADACQLPPDWAQIGEDLRVVLSEHVDPLDKWADGAFQQADVAEDHLSQKWWSHKIHRARSIRLLSKLVLRDRARYDLQKMPGTTTWMTVTPNEGLGLKMDSRDYRFLLKWWLGRPLAGQDRTKCPCCEGQMDQWGDHLVSCNYNQPAQRHNALRDALAEELSCRNIASQKEVPIGGARRPADIGLPSLDSRGPLAVDIVVHHPLSLSENRSSENTRASLRRAEEQKAR